MKKIKLSDGRVVESYDPTVREFAKAAAMEDNVSKQTMAALSATILVDGKPITVDEFRNKFTFKDFIKIQSVFKNIEVEFDKNSAILSNGKVATLYNPLMGEFMDRLTGDDNIEMYMPYNMASSMIKVDGAPVGISDFLDNYHYSDYLKIMGMSGEMPKNA